MTILDELAAAARERVRVAREGTPAEQVLAEAEAHPARPGHPFERALRGPGVSLICEVKRASPSRGMIAEHFDPIAIARTYAGAGADAISVLTEPHWFLGSTEHLRGVTEAVPTPVLRKDFTVAPDMIARARLLGADAVLLICAILDDAQLRDFSALAAHLGMSALFEAHTAEEIDRALDCGARIIGVNNRNLHDFHIDRTASSSLRDRVPDEVLFVSESGVRGPADVSAAARIRADAVLVGEALMRAPDVPAAIAALHGAGATPDGATGDASARERPGPAQAPTASTDPAQKRNQP